MKITSVTLDTFLLPFPFSCRYTTVYHCIVCRACHFRTVDSVPPLKRDSNVQHYPVTGFGIRLIHATIHPAITAAKKRRP